MARTQEHHRVWAGEHDDYELRVYAHPGRFEGGFHIDQWVAGLSADEEDSAEGIGWVGLLRGDLLEGVQDAAREDGDHLEQDEAALLNHIAGAIVSESDQGFVDVEYYETKKELDDAWEEVVDEFSEYHEET